jgi:glycosyltransferase involved in cell wall biosynthesis
MKVRMGDVLLISQGGFHDPLFSPALRVTVQRAKDAGIPYVVAVHSVTERSVSSLNRNLLRHYYSGSQAVVLPSIRLRDDLERHLAVDLPRAVEIVTPSPLIDVQPTAFPESSVLRLASVARLDITQKGHDVLLAALARTSWRHDAWLLDVYGTGPDASYLKELCEFYGLTNRVFFRGHTGDIAAVWADHHALVLPSRMEARGIAIIEAMACGRPAIATAVGGIPDSVINGNTGILAAAATTDAWTEALERLWRCRSELGAWGQEARRRVGAIFAEDQVERLAALLLGVARVQ